MEKFIREAHQERHAVGRSTHHNRKATENIISNGMMGVTWYGKKASVKKYIKNCGTCNRMEPNVKCRQIMGKSLNRIKPTLSPYRNVSIDPLGQIVVQVAPGKQIKIYPLLCMDINNGAVCFEVLRTMEAKEVFLALKRVEWRVGTQIGQIFTDLGSQLSDHLLGKKVDFYQQSLSDMWGVMNNQVNCQYKNLCERKVRTIKKLVKQSLAGKPGTIRVVHELSHVETVLTMVAHMANRVPYGAEGVGVELCPMDTLAPWQTREITVQQLPSSTLGELALKRNILYCIKEEIQQCLMEEFTSELRFKTDRLKLGVNKSAWEVRPGDLIQLTVGGRFAPGVLESCQRGREATVRLISGRRVHTAIGNLTPVAMARKNEPENGFTHFISIEFGNVADPDVDLFQTLVSGFPGMGKMVPKQKQHLTLGIVRLNTEDTEQYQVDTCQLRSATLSAVMEFADIVKSVRFLICLNGLVFLENNVDTAVCGEVKLGTYALKLLRGLLEDRLGEKIVDPAFTPHVTLFTQCTLSREMQSKMLTAAHGRKLGSFIADSITIRRRSGGDPEPVWKIPLHDPFGSIEPELLPVETKGPEEYSEVKDL